MTQHSILIANRGEIAIRIARACADLGHRSVAVHPEDDARSLHVLRADAVQLLAGRGAAAYLDISQIVAAAQAAGCTAVHPGYGFLSESDALAERCAAAGLTFIGPSPEVLRLLGDKANARRAAVENDVPVLAGTPTAVDAAGAKAFFALLPTPGMLIKAVSGGGGRGMGTNSDCGGVAGAGEGGGGRGHWGGGANEEVVKSGAIDRFVMATVVSLRTHLGYSASQPPSSHERSSVVQSDATSTRPFVTAS